MEPNSVVLPMVSVSLNNRRRMRSLWQQRFEKLHARSCQQGHLRTVKMENSAMNDVHLGEDGPAAARSPHSTGVLARVRVVEV